MMEKELKVGIGDMKFARGEGSIITYALGSCIGIAFYDPFIHLGALLHIMLPSQFNYNRKYWNTEYSQCKKGTPGGRDAHCRGRHRGKLCENNEAGFIYRQCHNQDLWKA